jgi:hypothetical protein
LWVDYARDWLCMRFNCLDNFTFVRPNLYKSCVPTWI